MEKVIISSCSLAGCFGCHTSLLDIDERILELATLVEFDRSPITDIKRFERRSHIGIIEGGCCNEENVRVLQEFRDNCDLLVAVGQCATMGGVPGMRNAIMHSDNPMEECLETVYLNREGFVHNPTNETPSDPAIPLMLDRVFPCTAVVKIDYQIPGCPPSADTFWEAFMSLINGDPPELPYTLIKYD